MAGGEGDCWVGELRRSLVSVGGGVSNKATKWCEGSQRSAGPGFNGAQAVGLTGNVTAVLEPPWRPRWGGWNGSLGLELHWTESLLLRLGSEGQGIPRVNPASFWALHRSLSCLALCSLALCSSPRGPGALSAHWLPWVLVGGLWGPQWASGVLHGCGVFLALG